MAGVPDIAHEPITSPYPGSTNGASPLVERPAVQPTIQKAPEKQPSVLEGTNQNLNPYASSEKHKPMPVRTKNHIAEAVNRYILYAQDVKNNPDLSADFSQDPFLAKILEMAQRHPEFSLWTEPGPLPKQKPMEGDLEPFNLFDPNTPEEKKEAKWKWPFGKKEEKKPETAAPKPKEFDISKFTDHDLLVIDTILRLEEMELAAAEGIEITNDQGKVRIRETFDEKDDIHPDLAPFALTAVDPAKGISQRIREKIKRSPSSQQTPENYQLLDQEENEAPSLATTERIIKGLGHEMRPVFGKYANHYKYSRERLGRERRIREIAQVHNASIAFREAIYGQKAYDALGRENPAFQMDRMIDKIGHNTERIRNEQFGGRTKLSPQERIQLKRMALKAALYEATNTKQEAAETQIEQDNEYRQDLIKIAQQKKVEFEENPDITETTYYETVENDEGDEVEEKIDAARYQTQDTEKNRLKGELDAKEQEIKTVEDTLSPDLITARRRLKRLLPEDQQNTVDTLTPVDILQRLKERQQEITERDAELDDLIAMHVIDFSDPAAVAAYLKARANISIDPRSGKENISHSESQLKYAQTKAEERQAAIAEKARLASEQAALGTLVTDIESNVTAWSDKNKQRADLQAELDKIKIRKTETKHSTAAQQTEFIIGEGDNPRIHMERQRHILETVYSKKDRDRSLESFDSLRNMMFNVETDAKKQETATDVLPREVMINSLARLYGFTKKDWQKLLQLKNVNFTYLANDGTIDWNARELATGQVMGTQMNVEQLKDRMEQYFLNMLRTGNPSTTHTVLQRMLNERLYAASQGKPTEFTGKGLPNNERRRQRQLRARRQARQQQAQAQTTQAGGLNLQTP